MTRLEKLVVTMIALIVAILFPGAVSSLDSATHRVYEVGALLGTDPAEKSTSQDVRDDEDAPIASKIRDVIDELLRSSKN